jgi:signal transduction histidine kinase
MRERIEALGGTLVRENNLGTKLSIQFPLIQARGNR